MASDRLLLELARFIERVNALARTGLAFQPQGYDAERYEELLREAARMHSAVLDAGEEEAELVRRQWRERVVTGYEGYVTPAVGVGIIAFNDLGELLMIRRANGRWWYPTGFCEVGVSPAENVIKEALEETGLEIVPQKLMALIDSRKSGDGWRHIYSILFYCRIEGGAPRPHPLEVLEMGFFPLDSLPEPLHGRDRRWIEIAREFHFEGRIVPHFD